MVKKLTLLITLLIASASLLTVSIFFAFSPPDKNPYTDTELYQNPVSIFELQKRTNKKIDVMFENKKLGSIDGFLTISQINKVHKTKYYTSLLNFFYNQSGTDNPLSIYTSGTQVFGYNIENKNIDLFLTNTSSQINRSPQNAILKIENGRAVEFSPDLTQRSLDKLKTAKLIKNTFLHEHVEVAVVAVNEFSPEITLSQTNELGINELIGRGVSDFSGSSKARIQNIRVGASRYNGLIIKQGAQFSFNDHLGPVTAAAGFLPELVIKAEGTVPEFGGGLCQVSSTAFRAAFFSGTRIDERRNHSYAVKYYKWFGDNYPVAEGMDATIYPGVVDMKFTNDTPAPILISTYFKENRLYFDFYGTSDNREVVLGGPEIYDKRASGALKAKVVRRVIKNGTESKDVFYSNYSPPDRYPRTYEYAEGIN